MPAPVPRHVAFSDGAPAASPRRGCAPPSTWGWVSFLGTPMTMIATMSLLLVAIRLAVHPSVDSIKSDIGDCDYAKTDVKADIVKRTCEYSEDVAPFLADRWKPREFESEYEYHTDVEFGSCILHGTQTSVLDSLVLSILVVLTHRLKGAGHGMLEPRADDFDTPGGQLQLRVI